GGFFCPAIWPAGIARATSLLHIFDQILRPDFGAIDVSGRVDRHAFGGAGVGSLLDRVGDETDDLAVLQAAPADAALPAIVIARNRLGFGIGDIKHVILGQPDAAGPAELVHLLDEIAVQVEDLDAVV